MRKSYENPGGARGITKSSSLSAPNALHDGVVQGQWSGEKAWMQATYPVTAGPHTFAWSYGKDSSASGGQDAAWIDDIELLPGP